MAKLDKNKWLSSDTYKFEEIEGKVFAIKSESVPMIKVTKGQFKAGKSDEMH